jgi:hypothetical protein
MLMITAFAMYPCATSPGERTSRIIPFPLSTLALKVTASRFSIWGFETVASEVELLSSVFELQL